MTFYARTSDHGYQSCLDHLAVTAALAGAFAAPDLRDEAVEAGLAHDLGKYSSAFQRRITHPDETARVDHSTAGAKLLMNLGQPWAAMAVAGHHAGLDDLGTPGDLAGSFFARMRHADRLLDDADRLDAQTFTDPDCGSDETRLVDLARQRLASSVAAGHVDARAIRPVADELAGRVRASERGRIADALRLAERSNAHRGVPANELDRQRGRLLDACRLPQPAGAHLFTLTAPTGAGKTNASLTFALNRAARTGRRRVIVVAPYTSIIDQTVEAFQRTLSPEDVLPHYADAPWRDGAEDDMTALDRCYERRADNWASPIVITTAVQFFETLYSSRPGRLRKLHNIADSVIVLDEAQTMPVGLLRPCVKALGALTDRYGCDVVLCSATQPALADLWGGRAREIAPADLMARPVFRRAVIRPEPGTFTADTLAAALAARPQVLCVVNTRRAAREVAGRLGGAICLTTLLTAADRLRLVNRVRARLAAGLPCRVVSTSLIEAGVDLDFPEVWRQTAGLDSVVQTAGRCNREGRRPTGRVHLFDLDGAVNPALGPNVDATRLVI